MATIVPTQAPSRRGHQRDESGAASAEYAVVTAAGVGIGGVLIKLLTSEWGQALLKKLLETFLSLVGVA
jgi:Flp pilus assembly pilin Flp